MKNMEDNKKKISKKAMNEKSSKKIEMFKKAEGAKSDKKRGTLP